MRFSYVPDVAEVLASAGKKDEAEALRSVYPNQFDMYGFEQEVYELAE